MRSAGRAVNYTPQTPNCRIITVVNVKVRHGPGKSPDAQEIFVFFGHRRHDIFGGHFGFLIMKGSDNMASPSIFWGPTSIKYRLKVRILG